jgi:hypothetical protein
MVRAAYLMIAFVSAILLAATAIAATRAMAAGAVAIGMPSNVAKNGAAFGYGVNHPTAEKAKQAALDFCYKYSTKVTKPLCRVVAAFENKCVAWAMDPAAGTPGVGWAVAESKKAAERTALEACERTAGPGRRAACRVSKSACDGSADAD